jgi:hypothetical protein
MLPNERHPPMVLNNDPLQPPLHSAIRQVYESRRGVRVHELATTRAYAI